MTMLKESKMSRFVAVETPGWPFVNTTVAYDVVDSTSDRAATICARGPLQTAAFGLGTHTDPRAGAGAHILGGPTPVA